VSGEDSGLLRCDSVFAGLVFFEIPKTTVPSPSRVERAKTCGGKGGQTGIPLLHSK